MQNHLDLFTFTTKTWQEFTEAGATSTGFRHRQRKGCIPSPVMLSSAPYLFPLTRDSHSGGSRFQPTLFPNSISRRTLRLSGVF